jgi:hypothetical protein
VHLVGAHVESSNRSGRSFILCFTYFTYLFWSVATLHVGLVAMEMRAMNESLVNHMNVYLY